MSNGYYKNKQLKEYYEGYISELKVDKQYHPILVDILLRRADLYDLSPEEIRQDVVSLVYNLNEISIGDMPEGCEEASGVFWVNKKKIILDKEEALKEDILELYQILTHEVYHVLSTDEYGDDRLANYNMFTGKYNNSILEAIVEKASYRAVYGNNKQDNIYFNNSACGYRDITFIADVIEATYGVSEHEFLKNGIMGRECLINFLAEQSGESPDETNAFLDEIEANYALLHNTLYPSSNDEKITRTQKRCNIKDAMTGIYQCCENKFSHRIMNKELHSYGEVVKFNDELKYNHNKFAAVMQDRLEYFNVEYDPSTKRNVYERAESQRVNTLSIINDLESVLLSVQSFSDEDEFLNICNWAQNGRLESLDEQYKAEHGIERNFCYDLPITKEIVDEVFDGEIFRNQYNNKNVEDLLRKVLKKETKEKKIFQKGIDKLKNLFFGSNSKKLLEEGKENRNMKKSELFVPLTKEQQEYYTNQVNQIVKQTKSSNKSADNKEIDEK